MLKICYVIVNILGGLINMKNKYIYFLEGGILLIIR